MGLTGCSSQKACSPSAMMQIKEAKHVTAINFLCPFLAFNGNRLGTVCWWLHSKRQQTLAVNSAALTKKRSVVWVMIRIEIMVWRLQRLKLPLCWHNECQLQLLKRKWKSSFALSKRYRAILKAVRNIAMRNTKELKCKEVLHILFDHWSLEGLTVSNILGLSSPSQFLHKCYFLRHLLLQQDTRSPDKHLAFNLFGSPPEAEIQITPQLRSNYDVPANFSDQSNHGLPANFSKKKKNYTTLG